jgi:Rrf2 family protein
MTILASSEDLVPSSAIAESLNANPALVRKELSNLVSYGLVASHEGKNGGYTLAKPPKQIQLSDIYEAVKPEAILGTCKNDPNPGCRIGRQINKHINKLYEAVDNAVIAGLGDTNLQTFSKQFK